METRCLWFEPRSFEGFCYRTLTPDGKFLNLMFKTPEFTACIGFADFQNDEEVQVLRKAEEEIMQFAYKIVDGKEVPYHED